MHHCLEILEILQMILRYLYDDGNLGSLASVAVTCRALHDPALDVLWHTLPALEYLVKCLPTDLWYLELPSEGSAEGGNEEGEGERETSYSGEGEEGEEWQDHQHSDDNDETVADESGDSGEGEEGEEWQGHQHCDENDETVADDSEGGDSEYGGDPIIRFKRYPVPDDFLNFRRYAARIRHLTFGLWVEDRALLDETVFQAIDRCTFGRPIFPALHSLKWQTEDKDVFPYISLFLFSELHSLSMCLMRNPNCPSPAHLTSLLVSSPQLRVLVLQSTSESLDDDGGFGKGPERLFDTLSELVCNLPCLETLRCDHFDLSPMALCHLASLPSLKVLQVGNNAFFIAKYAKRSPMFPSIFPKLVDLTMQGELEGAINLLSICRPKESVQMTLFEDDDLHDESEAVRQLFLLLAGLQESLETLKIEYLMDITTSYDCTITPDILQILFVCQNLNLLQITFPVDLTDASLHEAAISWPHLQALHLGKLGGLLGQRSRVTLQGLLPFAAYCPRLSVIKIVLHASLDDPAMCRKFKPSRRGSRLTYLDLDVSSVADDANAFHIAAFLRHLFPRLFDFHFNLARSDDPDNSQPQAWFDKWESVKTFLPHAQRRLADYYRTLKRKEENMFQALFNPGSDHDFLGSSQHLTWLDEWQELNFTGSSAVPGSSASSHTTPDAPEDDMGFFAAFIADDAWYDVDGAGDRYEGCSTDMGSL